MKNWKGIWIIIVAALHTVVAVINFGSQYKTMIANGVANSVNSAQTALAAWFFLAGILLLILGLLIYSFEKQSISISISIAITLLFFTILGTALMPVSGFWLLFPPVLAMLYTKDHS